MTKLYKIMILLIFFSSYYLHGQLPQSELVKIIRQIQSVEDKKPDSVLIVIDGYLSKYKDYNAQAELYIEKAQCYAFIGKKDSALVAARKAKDMAYLNQNYSQFIRTCGLLANRYRNINLVPKAKSTLREGFANFDKINDQREINLLKSMFYTEYAKLLTMEKKYDSATVYNKRALSALSLIKISKKVKFQYGTAYLASGVNYLGDKSWKLAENDFIKTIEYAKNSQWEKYQTTSAKIFLSTVYTHNKEYQRAIDTLKAVEKDVISSDDEKMMELYYYLAENYKKIDDDKNYQKYNELYLKARNSSTEEDIKSSNETLKIMDDILKDEKEKKQLYKIAILSFGALAIAGLFFIISYFKRKNKKEQLLFQNVIAKLENKLQEKSNISTDIVDFPLESPQLHKQQNPENQKERGIPEEVEKEILAKLSKFENSTKFTNPKLSLSLLSSQLGTNASYLSEVINKHKGKNYYNYINELRVDYVCSKILNDPKYRNYKIMYLGKESGFSSHSVFATVFKNVTGISPSAFIKQSENQTE